VLDVIADVFDDADFVFAVLDRFDAASLRPDASRFDELGAR
jgi:hypothetical protein